MSEQCGATIRIRGKEFQCGRPAGHNGRHKAFEDWSGPFKQMDIEINWRLDKPKPEPSAFEKAWDHFAGSHSLTGIDPFPKRKPFRAGYSAGYKQALKDAIYAATEFTEPPSEGDILDAIRKLDGGEA